MGRNRRRQTADRARLHGIRAKASAMRTERIYFARLSSFTVEVQHEPPEREPPARAAHGRPSRHRRLGRRTSARRGAIPVLVWRLGVPPLLRALSLLSAAGLLSRLSAT